MAQNFIACDRGQPLLLPPDLTEWVPDDHVVWSILGAVDQVGSVIIEWQVDDVDAEYARLAPGTVDWVQTPTTMPWGNRSVLLRDPDGNLVNLYTPTSDDARQRFAER